MSILGIRFAPLPMYLRDGANDGGAGGAAAGAGGDKPAAGAAAAGAGAGGAAAGTAAPAAGAGGDGAAAAAAAAAAGEKPAAGAAPAAGTGTIAGGDKAAAAAPVAGKWPDNWRQELAGEDKAALKTLERYAAPTDVWKALNELRGKVSSGELKAVTKAPENATPEQMTAWRKEQGLPEKPEGYIVDLKLPDGIVPGEADKPLLDGVAKMAFENGIPQETVNKFASWFYQTQDAQMAARDEADQKFHDESLSALSQEWGKELKVNQNYIGNLLAVAPEGVADQILTARLPNGRMLGDDPGALRFLVAAAREAFPSASVVPAGTANAPAAVASRMGELEGMMGDQRSAYHRGPQAAALQAEYAELVDAQLKMKNKAG